MIWLIDNRSYVITYRRTSCSSGGYGTFMTTAEISDKLVIKGSIKKPMPLNRLGMIMKKAGYKDVRRGAMNTQGWLVREKDADEVNADRRIMAKE